MIQLGIDSFLATFFDPAPDRPRAGAAALADVLDRVALADQVGLDVFGIGEHHRAEFVNSAPALILAAAARTHRIRLTSAVTVLSTDDPVRVFQQFATLDLLSRGRVELTVGRGSAVEAYPLFGFDLNDYDALFAEKLDLLLHLRTHEHPHWSGRFRPPLTGQGVYPRPWQPVLPIWLGVGGTPASFERAGTLGLPLMVAVIGGEVRRFRPLVDRYRAAGRRAGHPPEQLRVGLHALGYVAATTGQAADEYFPGYARLLNHLGRERGWPPVTRAGFEAQRGPHGAFLVGSPAEIAVKIQQFGHDLGGLARVTLQADNPWLSQAQQLRSIELLGTQVAPLLRA